MIASLPANDAALAKAAAGNGADMVKIHLNVTHRASGTLFGGWNEEKPRIQAVLDAVNIPVGVMPGSEVVAGREDWNEMLDAGISFFDIYAHHMPAWMWRLPIKKMPAIAEIPSSPVLMNICRGAYNSAADWLEASIINPEDYGKPLNAEDLAKYRWICECVDTPVVIPTQKAISPLDLPALAEAGVAAIMVGKIVTGDTVASLGKAVAEFRKAADEIK
ncbi:MAG: hypothetical protein HRF49_06360 [bacterium]